MSMKRVRPLRRARFLFGAGRLHRATLLRTVSGPFQMNRKRTGPRETHRKPLIFGRNRFYAGAHNGLVAGSSPARPTKNTKFLNDFNGIFPHLCANGLIDS
jgi:hypothetical protein